jgi:hypothetical protein
MKSWSVGQACAPLVLLSCFLTLGCDQLTGAKEANPEAQKASVQASADSAKKAAEASAKKEAEAKAAADAQKNATPDLDRGLLDVEKIKEAKKLDKEGDELFDKGDLKAAEAKYREALKTDAGNVYARYNLARTLAKGEKTKEATDVILELNADGCLLCAERLLNAKLEEDFKEVQKDPAFIEATKDAHKKLKKESYAFESLGEWFRLTKTNQGDLEDNPYLDARSTIVVEDRSEGAKQRFVQLHGSADFRRYLKETFPEGMVSHGPAQCKNGCCTLKVPTKKMMVARELCLQLSGTSAVAVKKIVVEGDPAFLKRMRERSENAKQGAPPAVNEKRPPRPDLKAK